MPYFRDTKNNRIYWLDNSSDISYIPVTCIEITNAEANAILEENKPIPPSKTKISARQIRMALTQIGLRNDVETAVAAGNQDTKDWYEFSAYFDRNHPQVLAMATALNVDDQKLDNLWALATTL